MRSASVCSVTTMEPISAAMPAPTRVASGMAPTEAIRSRTWSFRKVAPKSDMSGMILRVCKPIWYATMAPMKAMVMPMKNMEPLPMAYICRAMSPFSRLPRTQ
jgi:hypothetical protein